MPRSFPCPVQYRIPTRESHFATGNTGCLFWCRRCRYDATGGLVLRWKLGFSQCRFHHANRTCSASPYISSGLTAFPTCSCPLWVSPSGKLGVLEGFYSRPSAPFGLSSERRSGAHCQSHGHMDTISSSASSFIHNIDGLLRKKTVYNRHPLVFNETDALLYLSWPDRDVSAPVAALLCSAFAFVRRVCLPLTPCPGRPGPCGERALC